jgi:hypothetical protein
MNNYSELSHGTLKKVANIIRRSSVHTRRLLMADSERAWKHARKIEARLKAKKERMVANG